MEIRKHDYTALNPEELGRLKLKVEKETRENKNKEIEEKVMDWLDNLGYKNKLEELMVYEKKEEEK